MFLEREVVNPSQANSVYAETALSFAAVTGHEEIVKMLLDRGDVNPNQITTGYSYSPLSAAACNGNDGVVKTLLEREDVNPNQANRFDGHTPLADAASQGHEGIVKMLLDRNDIRIDIQDHKNQTPLSLAFSKGHDKIVRMISERAAINSDTVDPGSQESLPSSAGDEDKVIEGRGLRDGCSNTNTANLSGEPISPQGDPDVPKELSDREGSVPDSADSFVPSTGRPVPLSSFPCSLRGAGVPEVKLPLIQTILRQLSQSRSTSIKPPPLSFVF